MSQATQQVLPTIDEETPFHKGDAMSTQEVVEHESDFVAQKPSNDMNKGSENMLPTIGETQIHEGNTRNSEEKMVVVENQSDVQTSPKPSDDMIIKNTYNMPLRDEEVEGSEKKDEANEEHQGALATTEVQDKVDKGTGKATRNANKAQSIQGRVQGTEGVRDPGYCLGHEVHAVMLYCGACETVHGAGSKVYRQDDKKLGGQDIVSSVAVLKKPKSGLLNLLANIMPLPCDLEVQVNGDQTFVLSKEILLPRCGRLLKEYRRALKAHRQRQEGGGITSVRMLLLDMPGGAKAFELVARFCYKESGWMKMGPNNVALMRCAAEYLEMSEEYGVDNLLQCTEAFLSTIAMWSWKDILILLSSCESLLPFAEKSGLIQLCVDSLALKASYHDSSPSVYPSSFNSPTQCSISPTPKPSALNRIRRSPKIKSSSAHFIGKSINRNQSPSFPCSPDPCCRTLASQSNSPSNHCNAKHNWWFEDMSSLSMYMMERVVMAMQTHCINNKHISKVLLRYLEASLPLLGYSSLSIGIEKGDANEKTFREYAQRVQREVLESVVRLLHRLEWASVPVKSLFELRRVSITMSASRPCRRQIEEMIGCQLHRATLDNILTPRANGRDRRSCLYDVDLVLRLLKFFLHGEAVAKLQGGSGDNADLDPVVELELKYGYNGAYEPAPIRVVGTLIDKYLAEVAPDSYLKASKFSELAEALPSTARDTHDGLYKALDIYLQAHPSIPTEDAIQVCRPVDFDKLSFETCKHVLENPRIPAWVSFRVLALQQDKLRAALGTGLPGSRRTSSEDAHQCPPLATEYVTVVRQNEELRSDLRTMQAKINKLEKVCKGLKSQMSQDVWLSC
ncbi:hypothetical protein L7F22_004192 [Adiantum nelumboides]|nr:hypothetical protein [Adiantum nelumboides]